MVDQVKKLVSTAFFKFVIVGGISAIIELSLLILFVERIQWGYLMGNIMAFGLTNIFTFILTKRFVFNASGNENKTQEAALFTLCLLGGLLLNQMVLWIIVDIASIDYRIAKIAAIMVTVIWNFFSRKHFVFKNRAVATQRSRRSNFID